MKALGALLISMLVVVEPAWSAEQCGACGTCDAALSKIKPSATCARSKPYLFSVKADDLNGDAADVVAQDGSKSSALCLGIDRPAPPTLLQRLSLLKAGR